MGGQDGTGAHRIQGHSRLSTCKLLQLLPRTYGMAPRFRAPASNIMYRPSLLTATNFIILGRTIGYTNDQQYARLSPRMCTYSIYSISRISVPDTSAMLVTFLFVAFDILCLMIQGAGGGISSTANIHQLTIGNNVALAGVAAQTGKRSSSTFKSKYRMCSQPQPPSPCTHSSQQTSFGVCVPISPCPNILRKIQSSQVETQVWVRWRFRHQVWLIAFLGIYSSCSLVWAFLPSSSSSVQSIVLSRFVPSRVTHALKLFRCPTDVLRNVQFADGWGGRTQSTETYFNVLDGADIVVAMVIINLLHPGQLMPPMI